MNVGFNNPRMTRRQSELDVLAIATCQPMHSITFCLTENGTSLTQVFKAVVELNTQFLNIHDEQFPLAAGMQLNAEIIEGNERCCSAYCRLCRE